MTAPKIDTQAPDTSREAVRMHLHRLETRGGATDKVEAAEIIRALLAERDLSAAREAAAAQAMREAITNSLRLAITLAEERLAGAIDEPWSAKHDKCIAGQVLYQEAIEYIDRLPLPDTTALDRLIAERVREARAFAREAIIHAINDLCAHLETYHDSEEDSRQAANLRHIWHHLEGTLIGMDEADAARGSKEGRDG